MQLGAGLPVVDILPPLIRVCMFNFNIWENWGPRQAKDDPHYSGVDTHETREKGNEEICYKEELHNEP